MSTTVASSSPCFFAPPRALSFVAAAASARCAGRRRAWETRWVRVIYYWAVDEAVCYMLYLYGKNEQGDLTPTQIRMLGRLVREEFK
jgi:hypothetical protein